MLQRDFERLLKRIEDKNPELQRGEDIDDFFATYDVQGSGVSLGVMSTPHGKISITGDVPLPESKEKEGLKQILKAGYNIFDIHYKPAVGEVHLHAIQKTSTQDAPEAIMLSWHSARPCVHFMVMNNERSN